MKAFTTLLVLFLSLWAMAAEESSKKIADDITEGAEKASNAVIDVYRTSSEAALDSRKSHRGSVLLGYSPLDLLLPSKIGATAAWHADENTIYELDYYNSSYKAKVESLELSRISETRVSFLKRNFYSGAFHWFWGLNYNSTHAGINEVMMNSAGGVSDVINVETLGLTVGVGHRWVFAKDFSFGIDWFSWAQPLVILKKEAPFVDATTNQEYKDEVDTALKVMGYFPRWAAFKLYVGYSF